MKMSESANGLFGHSSLEPSTSIELKNQLGARKKPPPEIKNHHQKNQKPPKKPLESLSGN
jgi:hypothetical protein